jgi:hypothetical protein
MSGYAPGITPGEQAPDPGIRLIKKPFRRDELAEILRRTLDDALEPQLTAPNSIEG